MQNTLTMENKLFTTMPEEHFGSYEAFCGFDSKRELWGYHSHDFYELYIHLRGGAYYGVDDRLYKLEPNQLVIVPPFCMHGMSGEGESCLHNYERGYLNVSSETLKVLGCGQIDLDRFFRTYTAQSHMFQMTEEEASQCAVLLRQLQQSSRNADEVTRLRDLAAVMRFMSVVCTVMERSETVEGTVTSNSAIQQVLMYINNNYTQAVNMKDLAKRFGLSVSFLSHGFARFTNHSVYDYVLYRRIMLAKEMIQSDLSLNTIAYQCGFNDYSNFLRAFNKVVGVSPSEYRRQTKK